MMARPFWYIYPNWSDSIEIYIHKVRSLNVPIQKLLLVIPSLEIRPVISFSNAQFELLLSIIDFKNNYRDIPWGKIATNYNIVDKLAIILSNGVCSEYKRELLFGLSEIGYSKQKNVFELLLNGTDLYGYDKNGQTLFSAYRGAYQQRLFDVLGLHEYRYITEKNARCLHRTDRDRLIVILLCGAGALPPEMWIYIFGFMRTELCIN